MERLVEFTRGCELRMVLKGRLGATQFVLFSMEMPNLSHFQQQEWKHHPAILSAIPVDLGYHSPLPFYEEQEPCELGCHYLDGKPCFYAGSGVSALRVYETMLLEGAEGVWKELEDFYQFKFIKLE